VHRLAYAGTGAGAVVHARSPFALAVSAACDAIPAVHYAIMALGGPDVRAGRDGGLAAALDGRHGALVRSDGAVTRGATLAQAWDRAELLEWLAEVYWRAQAAGTPRILSPAELGAVTEQARRHRYPGLS
jgi:L-fuculose-phosphate aldolase